MTRINVCYTAHGSHRQAQRNLSDDDIAFVLRHGRRLHGAGALHVFLGARDIPNDKEAARRYSRLEGTTLILAHAPDSLVLVTVYRNRRGFKAARAKAKYDRRERPGYRQPSNYALQER
jgi:hypothetical protein